MRLLLLALITTVLTSCATTSKDPVGPQPPAPTTPEPKCPDTVVDNRSDEPFNEMDQWNFDIAKNRCKQLYKNSPCLVKFIKMAPTAYGAICGGYNG